MKTTKSPGSSRGFLPPPKPACFDSVVQWHDWRRFATVGHMEINYRSHCVDCNIEYQTRMIKEKRCANPGHIFAEGGGE